MIATTAKVITAIIIFLPFKINTFHRTVIRLAHYPLYYPFDTAKVVIFICVRKQFVENSLFIPYFFDMRQLTSVYLC